MKLKNLTLISTALAFTFATVHHAKAETLVLDSHWVGGFFADGSKMNDFAHQNYFVGYGTTPGFGRTDERRSFFWFDIPDFEGTVTSASVKLKLAAPTSLIFGAGPGDDPGPEHEETFRMGAVPFSPHALVDPSLTSGMVSTIFGAMDDVPVSDLKVFLHDSPPEIPSDVIIPITGLGHSFIEAKRGSELVLTGWMPSWSYDTRVDDEGDFLEGSELIFGFSDITGPSGDLVPEPTLTIEYTPVPEPSGLLAAAAFGSLFAIAKRRRRKATDK